jgi:hypothetical protein
MNEFLPPYDHTSEYTTLTVNEFGGGMDHEICAESDGLLYGRGCEAVVHHQ